jgi:hypothetical protein
MTNLEMIQALIERTDKALLEQGAFDPVPLSEKTATMAMLYQAAALERIAMKPERIARFERGLRLILEYRAKTSIAMFEDISAYANTALDFQAYVQAVCEDLLAGKEAEDWRAPATVQEASE